MVDLRCGCFGRGRGIITKIKSSSAGRLGNLEIQTMRGIDGYGEKVRSLPGNFGVQTGRDSLKFPSTIMRDFLDLRSIKKLLVSLIRK